MVPQRRPYDVHRVVEPPRLPRPSRDVVGARADFRVAVVAVPRRLRVEPPADVVQGRAGDDLELEVFSRGGELRRAPLLRRVLRLPSLLPAHERSNFDQSRRHVNRVSRASRRRRRRVPRVHGPLQPLPEVTPQQRRLLRRRRAQNRAYHDVREVGARGAGAGAGRGRGVDFFLRGRGRSPRGDDDVQLFVLHDETLVVDHPNARSAGVSSARVHEPPSDRLRVLRGRVEDEPLHARAGTVAAERRGFEDVYHGLGADARDHDDVRRVRDVQRLRAVPEPDVDVERARVAAAERPRLARVRARGLHLGRARVDRDCFYAPPAGGEADREEAVAAPDVRDDAGVVADDVREDVHADAPRVRGDSGGRVPADFLLRRRVGLALHAEARADVARVRRASDDVKCIISGRVRRRRRRRRGGFPARASGRGDASGLRTRRRGRERRRHLRRREERAWGRAAASRDLSWFSHLPEKSCWRWRLARKSRSANHFRSAREARDGARGAVVDMEQGRPEDLFELLEQLGKGSYGAVYKVRARPTTLAAPPVRPSSNRPFRSNPIKSSSVLLLAARRPSPPPPPLASFFSTGASPPQRKRRRRQGHPPRRGGPGGHRGHPSRDRRPPAVLAPKRRPLLRLLHRGRVPVDRHGALRRRVRARRPDDRRRAAVRGADRVPVRRVPQGARVPALHLQGASRHQVQQHPAHRERRRQARGLWRRRAAHAHDVEAEYVHRDAALDGPGGDTGGAVRREGGRVGVGRERDRDGGGETAAARRASDAGDIHDHQGAAADALLDDDGPRMERGV
eukprot:31206-Pelagococcus_subviridis.AAC.12